MTKENIASQAVMGNFSLSAQLPNGKTFSVSGYIIDGESFESLNERVDILHDVVDRQRTRAEIPELEAKRDQMIKQLDQMREHMMGLEAKQNDGRKLTSQEKLSLTNISASLSKVQEEIDKGSAAIAAAKAQIARIGTT
jgi:chromosome segregation ATPase